MEKILQKNKASALNEEAAKADERRDYAAAVQLYTQAIDLFPAGAAPTDLYRNRATNNLRLSFEERLQRSPVVAILANLAPTAAAEVGLALVENGVTILEVPLRGADVNASLESVKVLAASVGGTRALVGAGTVLRVEQVREVAQAGAQLVVSPNCDVAVIRATKEAGMISIPGVCTPTEALLAISAGADALKWFPSDGASPKSFKATLAVLPKNIPVLAVGGVDASNLHVWHAAGARGYGVGSALFKHGLSAEQVGERAAGFVRALDEVREKAGQGGAPAPKARLPGLKGEPPPDGFRSGLRVTVFASSCPDKRGAYMAAASELGTALARAGLVTVFGGGNQGCMGNLAAAAEKAGGWVHGITHQQFMGAKAAFGEEACTTLQRLDVVQGTDLNERKNRLLAAGHVLVCLPGGVGTFDELFMAVALVATKLRTSLPVLLLNTDGYYDGLIAQLERAQSDGLLRKPWMEYVSVARTADEAVAWCVARTEAEHTFRVEGLACGGCCGTATATLQKLPGVSAATASAATKEVHVTGMVDVQAAIEALQAVGKPGVWCGVRPLSRACSAPPPRVQKPYLRGLRDGLALGTVALALAAIAARTAAARRA